MRFALSLLLVSFAAAQDAELIRTGVTLVPVTISATDKHGRPVQDLRADEVILLDNGHPREIRYFSQDFDAPLTVGLITDNSGSQREFFEQHASTIQQFVTQVLRPSDKGFLVSISGSMGTGDVRMVQDLTQSVRSLHGGIDRLRMASDDSDQFGDPCVIPGCRGTALWNSIYSAVDLRMRSIPGRKALIVLSDGIDMGSQHSLESATEAAQNADTPVYTILTAQNVLSPNFGFRLALMIRGGQALSRLAEATGGRAFGSSKNGSEDVFAQIEAELRNLYVVTFAVPESELDGKFHKLEVKTSRKGLRVHARAGYTSK